MIKYRDLKNTPEFKKMLKCAIAHKTTLIDFTDGVWTPASTPLGLNGWNKTLRMDKKNGVYIVYDCYIDGEWQLKRSKDCQILAYKAVDNHDDTSSFYQMEKKRN